MVLEMFNSYETMLGRPRCRNWLPLATQQVKNILNMLYVSANIYLFIVASTPFDPPNRV